MSKYEFKEIEAKWQKYWEEHETFKTIEDDSCPKEKRAYVLDMFPYPSGDGLHVGHPEGYTATDIYSRFLRMKGYNVLHPMGFDSFGLPAENYAIKTGAHPKNTTDKNIANFERQIKALGFSYDWSRKVVTSEKDYYKWTQYLFLKLYEKGLAYEKEAAINWCPSCMTGLANEEVKDGKCERCSSTIERKNVRQWFLKITEYAEQLLQGLDELDWPSSIKQMQKNWIGKSEGVEVDFAVKLYNDELLKDVIKIFTTRVDTIYGVTYIVLSPEHPLLSLVVSPKETCNVEKYVSLAKNKTDLERTDLAKEKTGVFTGSYAIHPLTGNAVPIWVSDYVLTSYGTGAVMAVPCHDERDWEFANKFSLPKIKVVAKKKEGLEDVEECFTEEGFSINSGNATGLSTKEAKKYITSLLENENKGKKKIYYKMRDWVFSRQRYWGEPIPLVHCPNCGIVPLSVEQLPLTLPEIKDYKPSNTTHGPLSTVDNWVNTICPKCGAPSKRETNTMPQWAGSCWYYLRYTDPKNNNCFADKEKIDYWLPVNIYVGGAEHAVLHLLYARFWHKVLYDVGLVSEKEPFKKLVNQGLITSFAYMKKNKSLVPVDEVKEVENGKFIDISTGETLTQVIAKMSKSLKNVVNPDDIIKEYGADSFRMYEMFLGPLEVSKPWNTNGIIGIYRFLEKVWALLEKPRKDGKIDEMSNEKEKELTSLLHKTIKKVTQDTQTLNFNTAISQMMIFVNEISRLKEIPLYALKAFLKLLSPYAPHITEEMWEKLGEKNLICKEKWPSFIEEYCYDKLKTIVISINGKVKGKLEVPQGTCKEEIIELAFKSECVKKLAIDKNNVKKIIVVPDKIINLVV